TEKPSCQEAEKDRPVCVVADGRYYRLLHLAVYVYREQNQRRDSSCYAANAADRRGEGDGSLGDSEGWKQCQIPDQTTPSRHLGNRQERRNFERESLILGDVTIAHGF